MNPAGLAWPPYKLKLPAFSNPWKKDNRSLRGPWADKSAAARFIPYGVRAAAATVIQFPSQRRISSNCRVLCCDEERFNLVFFDKTMQSSLLAWGTVHSCLFWCNNAEVSVGMGTDSVLSFLMISQFVRSFLSRCKAMQGSLLPWHGSVSVCVCVNCVWKGKSLIFVILS